MYTESPNLIKHLGSIADPVTATKFEEAKNYLFSGKKPKNYSGKDKSFWTYFGGGHGISHSSNCFIDRADYTTFPEKVELEAYQTGIQLSVDTTSRERIKKLCIDHKTVKSRADKQF